MKFEHKLGSFSIPPSNDNQIVVNTFSNYVKLNDDTGVKQRGAVWADHSFDYLNKEIFVQSYLSQFGIAPKIKSISKVFNEKSRRCSRGIVMQHINGRTLADCNDDNIVDFDECREIENRLYELMSSVGVNHEDLHHNNIMCELDNTNKITRFWAIDFELSSCNDEMLQQQLADFQAM